MVDEVLRAVWSYADLRIKQLAHKIIWHLRRVPPSGIDGDDPCIRSIWDELRQYMRKGPIEPLESLWDQALFPYCSAVADTLSEEERRILWFDTADYINSLDYDLPPSSDADDTAFEILRRVKAIALDEELLRDL